MTISTEDTTARAIQALNNLGISARRSWKNDEAVEVYDNGIEGWRTVTAAHAAELHDAANDPKTYLGRRDATPTDAQNEWRRRRGFPTLS